jgi:hypothetical protein
MFRQRAGFLTQLAVVSSADDQHLHVGEFADQRRQCP